MDWKDVAPLISKAAPLLGSLLASSTGGLSVAAGAMVSRALDTAPGPEAVAQALQGADAAAKLRELELTHKERLEGLVIQSQEIAARDRADARQAQVQTRSTIPGALAIGVTLGFFGVLAAMLANVWKPSDNQALLILLGSLGTSWGAIVNFYFGSSAGSARKDELLAGKG